MESKFRDAIRDRQAASKEYNINKVISDTRCASVDSRLR